MTDCNCETCGCGDMDSCENLECDCCGESEYNHD